MFGCHLIHCYSKKGIKPRGPPDTPLTPTPSRQPRPGHISTGGKPPKYVFATALSTLLDLMSAGGLLLSSSRNRLIHLSTRKRKRTRRKRTRRRKRRRNLRRRTRARTLSQGLSTRTLSIWPTSRIRNVSFLSRSWHLLMFSQF